MYSIKDINEQNKTYVLSDKAACLYKMKEYEEANRINEECLKISEEMKDERLIFYCKICIRFYC